MSLVADQEKLSEDFIKNLVEIGAKTYCDDSSEAFQRNTTLPPFYDKELFERGKKFFHDNIVSITMTKLFGILTSLSSPTIFNVLKNTEQLNSAKMAYKHYSETLSHLLVWYDNDFGPESRAWKSLQDVKSRQNLINKKNSTTPSLGRINQLDMVITQFGMFGYALLWPKWTGLEHANKTDWEGLIHFWRVLGYMLGIEDRFNICKSTVEETKICCKKLLNDVIRWNYNAARQEKEYQKMVKHTIEGVACINPFFEYHVTMVYFHMLVTADRILLFLNIWGRLYFVYTLWAIYLLKFKWYRICSNTLATVFLWFANNLPILAYFKFGFTEANTNIRKKIN